MTLWTTGPCCFGSDTSSGHVQSSKILISQISRTIWLGLSSCSIYCTVSRNLVNDQQRIWSDCDLRLLWKANFRRNDLYNIIHKIRPVWPAKTQISLSIHPVWQGFSFIGCKRHTLLTHLCLASYKRDIGKQCRRRSDAAECGVWSGFTLFTFSTGISIKYGNNKTN